MDCPIEKLLLVNQRGGEFLSMTSQQSHEQLEHEFYRDFDNELEGANLSLTTIHEVLNKIGAPKGNGAETTTVAQRLSWLIVPKIKHKEERVQIGENFQQIPQWRFLASVPLIYIPILVGIVPMILCVLLARTHLRMVGARNLKSYWKDFVPNWVSHRYIRENQIVSDRLLDKFGSWVFFAGSKLFWIFNCKLYCPLSVALLAYGVYLGKIVEQWWCPFGHDKKHTYSDAPIDKSFWHANGDVGLLHSDDRKNPSWNQETL
jgi:hypothetical protein